LAGAVHHREIEEAVLSAAMLDQELADRAAVELSLEDFSTPPTRLLFGSLLRLHAGKQPFDVRTVQAELEATGDLERVGGVAYIATIELNLPDLSRYPHYVAILKAATLRRQFLAAQRARSGDASTVEIVAELSDSLRSLQERGASAKAVPLGRAFASVHHRLANPARNGMLGVPSGFPKLDRMTQGFQPGQLVVIAGRPGMGKTVAATCFAKAAAEVGFPVLFMSLEMGTDELAARIVSSESAVPFWQIRSGYLGGNERATVERACRDLEDLPLYIDDSPGLTPAKLAATIRRAQREHDVRLVVVDYLGLMAADGDAENQNLRLAGITRSLKLYAKELEVPIIVLHQLSRAPEKRTDPRPILSDLRDSGAIEQDADSVLFIWREQPKPGEPSGPGDLKDAEFIVAKHRNGPTGTVYVKQRLDVFRFDP
jgi:replicative DNA helicase